MVGYVCVKLLSVPDFNVRHQKWRFCDIVICAIYTALGQI